MAKSDHSSEGIRIVRMPGPASPALVEFAADHSGHAADATRTYAYSRIDAGLQSYVRMWFSVDLSGDGSGYLLSWRDGSGASAGYRCTCRGFAARRTCRHVVGAELICRAEEAGQG